MPDSTRFILLNTSHPGNVGAAARAMKVMGFSDLVLVAPHAMAGAEKEMLSFETLTLAPIDLALVDTALLDGGEKAWLNAYHARVLGEIGPLVDAGTQEWLEQVTRPL